jgi:hypothetical protein
VFLNAFLRGEETNFETCMINLWVMKQRRVRLVRHVARMTIDLRTKFSKTEGKKPHGRSRRNGCRPYNSKIKLK